MEEQLRYNKFPLQTGKFKQRFEILLQPRPRLSLLEISTYLTHPSRYNSNCPYKKKARLQANTATWSIRGQLLAAEPNSTHCIIVSLSGCRPLLSIDIREVAKRFGNYISRSWNVSELCRSHFNAIPSIIVAVPLTPRRESPLRCNLGLYTNRDGWVVLKLSALYIHSLNKGVASDDISPNKNFPATSISGH